VGESWLSSSNCRGDNNYIVVVYSDCVSSSVVVAIVVIAVAVELVEVAVVVLTVRDSGGSGDGCVRVRGGLWG